MKKLLFLGACLVALASQPVKAQTTDPQAVIVQVAYTGFGGGRITVIRGVGKSEATDFGGAQSGEVLQVAITKLYQEGYSLKGTFAPGNGTSATMVFVKGQ